MIGRGQNPNGASELSRCVGEVPELVKWIQFVRCCATIHEMTWGCVPLDRDVVYAFKTKRGKYNMHTTIILYWKRAFEIYWMLLHPLFVGVHRQLLKGFVVRLESLSNTAGWLTDVPVIFKASLIIDGCMVNQFLRRPIKTVWVSNTPSEEESFPSRLSSCKASSRLIRVCFRLLLIPSEGTTGGVAAPLPGGVNSSLLFPGIPGTTFEC